jgi:hypothetical protein
MRTGPVIKLYWLEHFFRMAAAVTAIRANKPPVFEDIGEDLLDALVSKLPSKETWEAEFFLGILVLG